MEREVNGEQEKIDKEIFIIKVVVLIVLIIAFIILIVYLVFAPTIDLKKSKEISITYPKVYKEPGYKAKSLFNDLTNKVKVKGKVNSQKIGTYKITYIVKNFLFTAVTTRSVKVVDKEKPQIILKGKEETDVCPNANYQEEGYEVTDNYDKDLKDKVKVTVTDNEIVYTVKDSSGNKAKVIRKLIYQDKIKPDLKLKGSTNLSLTIGSTYLESGYTAIDNCDGDVWGNVKVMGSVNPNKLGTYTLTYNVQDKAGNEAIATRKVTIRNIQKTNSGCGIAGAIYLTFDDGPNASSTAQILNVLKEEGVKATFFVTNAGPDALIKRAYDEGHTIGLHTASHKYNVVYASVNNYFNDLNAVANRVKRITGYDSKFIRFPGGSSNTVSRKYSSGIMTRLASEVVNRGYKYYDWNVDSGDAGTCAKSKSSSCVYSTTTRYLSKNKCNMVLMHDIKSYTADALRNIIKYGKQNGYIFKQIDSSTPIVSQGINN